MTLRKLQSSPQLPPSQQLQLLLPLLLLLLLLQHSYVYSCVVSNVCTCHLNKVITVNCLKKNLQKMPNLAPQNPGTVIYEIVLRDNFLRDVPAYSFLDTGAKSLDISGNPLKTIDENAFVGLEATLTTLNLGKNDLEFDLDFSKLYVENLTNLESLTLTYFRRTSIQDGIFLKLNNLKYLSMTNGKLRNIAENTFEGLYDSLEVLDLTHNDLEDVPYSAIKMLKNLKMLDLDYNKINYIKSEAFENNRKLEELHLSYFGKLTLDINTFYRLDKSLLRLTLSKNGLDDSALNAVKRCQNLNKLDISSNNLKTINPLLDGEMKKMEILNAETNNITNFTSRAGEKLESNTLTELRVSDNPSLNVAPDSFTNLSKLQSLLMRNIGKIELNEGSFISQKTTLKKLHLSNVLIEGSYWSALANLKVLTELLLESTSIDQIPDLIFRNTPNLNILALNRNNLQNITQRTFTGLERNVNDLSLQYNKITSIDECVFHEFKSLNIIKLRVEGNPLICDCRLSWLYDKVKILLNDPKTKVEASSLHWRCDNLNIRFVELNDNHFQNCSKLPSATCEKFVDTLSTDSPLIPTPSSDSGLKLSADQVTCDSVLVRWVLNTYMSFGGFRLICQSADESTSPEILLNTELPSGTTEYLIKQLSPNTAYKISIIPKLLNRTEDIGQASEISVTTQTWGETHKSAIVGATVGSILALVLLILAVICICLVKRNQINRPKVEVTDHSRRYVKSIDYSTSTARRRPGPVLDYRDSRQVIDETLDTDPADVIKSTLQSMTDEEKYKLASLLTSSRNSLDVLDENGSSVYDVERRKRDYGKIIGANKHIYEEIPNSELYDEINEDKLV